jgi:hypothetical protein
MSPKNDYSVIAFYEGDKAKKWTYVHNLKKFANFLDDVHPGWKYLNVYERRTKKFLRQFKQGSEITPFPRSTNFPS